MVVLLEGSGIGRGKSGGEIVEEGLELRRLKVRVYVVMKVPIGDGYRESRGSS